jgi:hypothetical protein
MTDLTPEQQAVFDADLYPEHPSSKAITAWYARKNEALITEINRLIAENKLLRANPWKWSEKDGTIKSVVAIPGTQLIAMSDTEIVGIVVWKDRLICATKKGVFERGEDGKFREIKFAPKDNVAPPPEAESDERWRTIGKLVGKNPPPPPLKPSERLYPSPIASAIYTDIVRWQAKNYGVAPPCWMIPITDYIALCKEFGAKDGEEISGDIKIAGIKIVVDPAALSVKYDTPAPLPEFPPPIAKMLSEVTREHVKPCASILKAAYEGPDHVLTQGEESADDEADPPMCRHGTKESEGWCVQCEVFGSDGARKNPKVLCIPDNGSPALSCAYNPACENVCRRYGYEMKVEQPPLSQRGFGTDKDG